MHKTYAKKYIPLLFLALILWTAKILPVPKLPQEKYFVQHHTEYEHIVQIAKTHGLPEGTTQCQAKNAYDLPPRYKHLTLSCVYIYESTIEFIPMPSTFVLVYAEFSNDLSTSWSCAIRGSVWKQLEENWFLCVDADD